MHFPLFGELIVILGLAAGILLLFRRFKLPGILGFILTGMIAGPHGLGWVREVDEVQAMAEIGVIFLMFGVGQLDCNRISRHQVVLSRLGLSQITDPVLHHHHERL